MRLCPTIEGVSSPLITHRIGVGVCMARQGDQFHKCHKCVFRGKTADWQPEELAEIVVELTPAVAPAKSGRARRKPKAVPDKVAEAQA